jgi:hypothetical protein
MAALIHYVQASVPFFWQTSLWHNAMPSGGASPPITDGIVEEIRAPVSVIQI